MFQERSPGPGRQRNIRYRGGEFYRDSVIPFFKLLCFIAEIFFNPADRNQDIYFVLRVRRNIQLFRLPEFNKVNDWVLVDYCHIIRYHLSQVYTIELDRKGL